MPQEQASNEIKKQVPRGSEGRLIQIQKEHFCSSVHCKGPEVTIKPVAVSAPWHPDRGLETHFLPHGHQDFLEKWLALGLVRKYMR